MCLLKPGEVDVLLRYPTGRTLRLVKRGLIPALTLPDGEVRIERKVLDAMLCTGGNDHLRRGAGDD